jgi:hypothetical protein
MSTNLENTSTKVISNLSEIIDKKISEVRVRELDISFGELISLHEEKELIISPDYQRLFRWSDQQQSRLIESILVGLPIPPIFVVENQDGALELVDGLQRISTILRFLNPDSTANLSQDVLKLEGCDIIEQLNGLTFPKLPINLRLHIKRSSVRMVMIQRQSSYQLRYEMFKRLNTGGTLLSSQEIRNCSARMAGNKGVKFYDFLIKCSKNIHFSACIETLPEREIERKGNEELVLRFFALKNSQNSFKGHVTEWLDGYMDSVILEKETFNYKAERETFKELFEFLEKAMKAEAFVRFREGHPIGGLAPTFFEGYTMGTLQVLDTLKRINNFKKIRNKMVEIRNRQEFLNNIGPGANTQTKLERRIQVVKEGLLELT